METLCEGETATSICPIRGQCYRYTCPIRFRDRYQMPYNFVTSTCELYETNEPSEKLIESTAYYAWLTQGKPEGQATKFWDDAKRSLQKNMNRFFED
jgi:Protein of unknown function (DUF2934)